MDRPESKRPRGFGLPGGNGLKPGAYDLAVVGTDIDGKRQYRRPKIRQFELRQHGGQREIDEHYLGDQRSAANDPYIEAGAEPSWLVLRQACQADNDSDG